MESKNEASFPDSQSSEESDLHRYPGFRPFQDNDVDRKLFFGRKNDKASILDKILAERLVVLYAKSGMGKTSLLNAGVLKSLREKEYIPLVVRLHEPEKNFWQSFYESVEEEIEKNKKLRTIAEYIPGKKSTLWEFIKTAEIWSFNDILLSPILILDQFEEIFTLHNSDDRKDFFEQMADIVLGRPPKNLSEKREPDKSPYENYIHYSEKKPNIKVVIAIRETFLGHLEELAEDIPAIFNNRFKLEPLNRKNAEEAIVGPSKVKFQDETLNASGFNYDPEAVTSILDFLCSRENSEQTMGNESVEPFQLQLICSHIETNIQSGSKKEVYIDDLGGEDGMQQIMQEFYDIEMQSLPYEFKRLKKDIQKLFENGFISRKNRRLTLHSDDIKDRFGISENVLRHFIHRRLLRSELKRDEFIYELSHDTLIMPIRESQKKRKVKEAELAQKRKLEEVEREKERIAKEAKIQQEKERVELEKEHARERAETEKKLAKARAEKAERDKELEKARAEKAEQDKELAHRRTRIFRIGLGVSIICIFILATAAVISFINVMYFMRLGTSDSMLHEGKYTKALTYCEKAMFWNDDHPGVYLTMGKIFNYENKHTEAIKYFEDGIKKDPKYYKLHVQLGTTYLDLNNEEKAIYHYIEAYSLAPKDIEDKVLKTIVNFKLKSPVGVKARKNYQEAISMAPFMVDLKYYDIVIEGLISEGKNDEANEYEERKKMVIETVPTGDKNYIEYQNLGYKALKEEKDKVGIEYLIQAIDIGGDIVNVNVYTTLGYALLKAGMKEEAIGYIKKAIDIAPDKVNMNDYTTVVNALLNVNKEEEAINIIEYAFKKVPSKIDASVLITIGKTLLKQNKEEKALGYFKKAIDLSPHDVDAYTYVMVREILLKQNKRTEAKKYDEIQIETQNEKQIKEANNEKRIREANFDSYTEYVDKGENLLRQNKEAEAIAWFKKAIEIAPAKVDANVYTIVGNALLKQDQEDEAIYYFKGAIEKDPENVEGYVYTNIGISLLRQNKEAEVIKWFEDSIKNAPAKVDANVYTNIGNYYFNRTMYTDAIKWFKDAIDIAPDIADASVYANLANALLNQNNELEAKEKYQKALKLIKENPNENQNLDIDVLRKYIENILSEKGKDDNDIKRFLEAAGY